MAAPLDDVSVFVPRGPGQDAGVHAALVAKLKSLGAKVCQRLGKDVTHIVFQRRTCSTSSADERAAEENELRSIHDRASKLDFPPPVVNTLWVSESETTGRRAMERAFLLARPADPLCPLLIKSPHTGGGSAHKRRRAPAAQGRRVKATTKLDVTDMLFSSSQQMHGDSVQLAALEEDTAQSPLPDHLARKQQQQQQHAQTFTVGEETQAAADILHDMAAMAYLEPTAGPAAATAGHAPNEQRHKPPAFTDISNRGRGTGVAGTSVPLTAAVALAAAGASKRGSGLFKPPRARAPKTPVGAQGPVLPGDTDNTAAGDNREPAGAAGAAKASTPLAQPAGAGAAGAAAGGSTARRRRASAGAAAASDAAAAAAVGDAAAALRSPAAAGSGGRASGLSAVAARKSLGKANDRRSGSGRRSLAQVTPEPQQQQQQEEEGQQHQQGEADRQAEEQVPSQHRQNKEQGRKLAEQGNAGAQLQEHESAGVFSFGAAAAGPSPFTATAASTPKLPQTRRRSRSAAPQQQQLQQQGSPQRLVALAADGHDACRPGTSAAAPSGSVTRQRRAAAAAAAAGEAAPVAATPPASLGGSILTPGSALRRSARQQQRHAAVAVAAVVSTSAVAAAAMLVPAVQRVAAALDAAAGPSGSAAGADAAAVKQAVILPDSEEAGSQAQMAPGAQANEDADDAQPDMQQQEQQQLAADEQQQQMMVEETDDDDEMVVDEYGNMHLMGRPFSAKPPQQQQQRQQPQQAQAAEHPARQPAAMPSADLAITPPPSTSAAAATAAATAAAAVKAPGSRKAAGMPAARATANKRRQSGVAKVPGAMVQDEPLPSLRGFKRPRLSAAAVIGQAQQQQQQPQEEDQQEEAENQVHMQDEEQADDEADAAQGKLQQEEQQQPQPAKPRQGPTKGSKASSTKSQPGHTAPAAARKPLSGIQPAALHKVTKTAAAAKATKGSATGAAKSKAAAKPAAHAAAARASAPTHATAALASAASGQRYLSWTSVPAGIAELAKGAIKRLGGMRLCVEGHEEGKLSHLLVGEERRTLKVLIGMANGAWLLTPEWLTASLEKGEWLPEEPYQSTCRFAATAAAARAARTQPNFKRPLEGKLVCIHCAGSSGTAAASGGLAQASEHKLSLQRLVRALGGRVGGPAAAELCVVTGELAAPRGLPAAAKAVKEEWLLQLAESHVAPVDERAFAVARK